jgi:hypothetical protein
MPTWKALDRGRTAPALRPGRTKVFSVANALLRGARVFFLQKYVVTGDLLAGGFVCKNFMRRWMEDGRPRFYMCIYAPNDHMHWICSLK